MQLENTLIYIYSMHWFAWVVVIDKMCYYYQMVTALQTEKRQSTEKALALLTARHEAEHFQSQSDIIVGSLDISALTDDQLRQECKESLVMMLRRSKGDLKALGAVRELLDRLEGRPIQRILEKTQRVDDMAAVNDVERIRQADEEADNMLKLIYKRGKTK